MEKVEYGVKCKVCGSLPELREIIGAKGKNYLCACPKCPAPVAGTVMRPTIPEARWDWQVTNKQGYRQSTLDAAMRSVRFLLELDAAGGDCPDRRVIEELQFMVDNHLVELFGAAVTLATKMTRANVLRRPVRLAQPVAPRPAAKPGIIMPVIQRKESK